MKLGYTMILIGIWVVGRAEREMHYDEDAAAMSKRELISRKLDRLQGADFDRLLAFLFAAESSPAKV